MSRTIWRPLRMPLFRALWIAALVSNVGTWMHDIGSAWLMTSLTQSPLMVSLLQTAVYLPFFLMALPAGAMADVFDRRRLLLVGHIWMMISAFGLAALTYFGLAQPWSLLLLTFALGMGAAISAPAWNALTPELVPRSLLQNSIALSSVSFNTARGIGSVVGGLLVAMAGPVAVFILNAFSFVGLIIFFCRWDRKPQDKFQHTETIVAAMKAGFRYVCHAPELASVLFRSALFAASASAFWALLPLVCRQRLGFSAIQYGVALGLFGIGTLIGASLLPRIRKRFSLDDCSTIGTLLLAMSVLGMAFAKNFGITLVFTFVTGAAWILVNSCLNLAVQLAVPGWVRARALAFHILVCQGSMAIGAVLWGEVAARSDLVLPLILSGLALAFGLVAITRFPLVAAEKLDLTMSKHWDDPDLVNEPEPEQGPVLVTVDYSIDQEKARDFADAMDGVRLQRLRGGAFQWHLFHDLSRPGRFVETYFIESWAEHMRQHERVTVTDRLTEEKASSFHLGPNPPEVGHFLSAYADRGASSAESENTAAQAVSQVTDYRFLMRM